jgi:hypothetical protein
MPKHTKAEPDEILAFLNQNAALFTADELRLYQRLREWDEQHPGDEENNPHRAEVDRQMERLKQPFPKQLG